MAQTLVITMATQTIDIKVVKIFLVAINITSAAKPREINIPWTTFYTIISSEGMNAQVKLD
jgi:hypothetical protein